MADALRAALRLFPVTKSSTGGASVACCRSSQVGRLAFADQSNRFPLSAQLQVVSRERQPSTVTGLARFAKAVLTYVGVGLSVVTANQFTGPSTLLAKEVKRESCIMSEDKSGSSWPYAASNRCLIHREFDKETASLYVQDDVVPTEKVVSKDASKTKVEEGLSFFPNEHWRVGDMADLPWQFGPSAHVDYGSQDITLEETSLAEFRDFSTLAKRKSDCSKSTEIELEWQWITDQQQQSTKSEAFPVVESINICKDDTEDAANKSQKGTEEIVGKLERGASMENSVSDGSKIKSCAPGSSNESSKSGNLFKELGAMKCQLKENASWRTADSEELAALVSQKTLEHLENCDLPPSQSSFTRKGPLASCDFTPPKTNTFEMSRSVDKLLLASLLHGYEPTRLENKSLPSSPLIMGMSDPTPMNQFPTQLSEPLTIPSVLPRRLALQRSRCFSSDDRNTSWNGSNGGSSNITGRGSDTLGEALCHSQTRAREAEKAVSQALQEKEQLVKLLFRETRTCCTYKQWVQTLEMENTWLKMCARDESRVWMEESVLRPSIAFNSFANNRWKHLGKQLSRKKMQHRFSSLWQGKHRGHGWVSEGKVVVGCTIGLAFALGLSFAGAGLMIGWSMGWILLAY